MSNHAATRTHKLRNVIVVVILLGAGVIGACTSGGGDDTTPTQGQTQPSVAASPTASPLTNNPLAQRKAELIQTANDYSQAAFSGDSDKAWSYISDRCQNLWGQQLFTLAVAKYAKYPDDMMPITSHVTIQGGTLGLVTRTWSDPELSQGAGVWAYDGNSWRMNDCD